MMHQLSYIPSFIILLIVTQSYLLSYDAVMVVALEETFDIAVDMFGPGDKNWQAVTAAAEQNEEIRTRLQQHVATQVNKLIQENKVKNNDDVDLVDGDHHKLKLNIELPADLAQLVQKHYADGNAVSGDHKKGAFKFNLNANGEIGELEDISDDSVVESLPNNSNEEGEASLKVSTQKAAVDDNVGRTKPSSSSSTNTKTTIKASNENTATPCPLGTYSKTGYYKPECAVCPEGQTTLKLGSTSCQVLTEEDILVMLYNRLQGDKWDEKHRKNWKSDRNICQWAGISCNEDGEVNGLEFPFPR